MAASGIESGALHRPEVKGWPVAILLFLIATGIYVGSPAKQFNDSLYSLVVSESLLTRGTVTLDPYFRPPLSRRRYPGLRRRLKVRTLPYQIESVRGHLYYLFPPGGSVLALPAVAVAREFGWSSVPGGRYDIRAETRLQKWLSALLCGLIVVVAYYLARLLLPIGPSLLAAAAIGFGSQVWSTASRALWSHTWLILVLLVAVRHLAVRRLRSRSPNPLWLGSLLAWSYFIRPTAAVSIGLILLYVLWRWRRRSVGVWLVVGLWMLAFVSYSWLHFGRWSPSYYRTGRLAVEFLPRAALADLISPSRGLLVFLPWLVMVAYLLVRYRRSLPLRDLQGLALTAVSVHWLVISAFPFWWGGHSYGPRLFADVIPWIIWLTIGALAGWGHARAVGMSASRWRIEAFVGSALLVLGIAIQAAGAISVRSMQWNSWPVDVARIPSRVWDWSDPQFLAWRHPRARRPATQTKPEPDSKWRRGTRNEIHP